MKFKILPKRLRAQTNNVLNANERLATNVVAPTPSSVFDKSYRHLTTFDSSKLVPIFTDECLPGDIFKIDVSSLIRMSLPNAATMENPVYDVSFFFVPNRIIWENWKYFMGENKDAGYQKNYKSVPLIVYSGSGLSDDKLMYNENDLASYLGFPQNVDMRKINVPISALWFKAYGKIWNDYYRDQNIQSEIDISNNNNNDENLNLDGRNPTDAEKKEQYSKIIQAGYGLAPVSRLADYFSTCLPYPQKGDSVTIDTLPLKNLKVNLPYMKVENTSILGDPNNTTQFTLLTKDGKQLNGNNTPGQVAALGLSNSIVTPIDNQNFTIPKLTESYVSMGIKEQNNIGEIVSTNPFNYSINDLRLSIAMQHIRELDARGGTRYIEYLLNHFGVQTSDSRLDRAEYIGGFRDNINISNVVQSAPGINGSTSEQLGSLGGVSISAGRTPRQIQYAVKEHGIIMGLVCVRPQINYSQGLDKKFTRVEKLDFYEPLLANIGEQPVYKYELFLSDKDNNENNAVFGYNEPWADYRYSFNKLTGFLSVNNPLSLSKLYAYTEKYANSPVLGEQWMYPDKRIIGNTLLLVGDENNSNTEFIHQFLADFYFKFTCERKMPVYSIPGLRKI